MINWQLVMMAMSRIKVIKFKGGQIIFQDGYLGGFASQMSAINWTFLENQCMSKAFREKQFILCCVSFFYFANYEFGEL